jgi:hypothetical protein
MARSSVKLSAAGAVRKSAVKPAKRVRALGAKTRLTLLMPAVLDRNLEVFSAKEGTLKTYVVIDALTEFLKKRGVQPDKLPKISW